MNTKPRSEPRLLLALLLVFGVVVLWRFLEKPSSPDNPDAPTGKTTGTVTLAMERGRGDAPLAVGPEVKIPWQAGLTVLAATQRAGVLSPSWGSRWQGEGEMALLLELGGMTNEGANGLNWQYDLNSEYAQQGAGQTTLRKGDHVLWRLAPYE